MSQGNGSIILDLHGQFLQAAEKILSEVRDRNINWMQSFIISTTIREIYTRNQNRFATPEEALFHTKEEIATLFAKVGLVTGDIEDFLRKSVSGII